MAQLDRPYTVRVAPLFQAECVDHGPVAPVRDTEDEARDDAHRHLDREHRS